MIIHLADDATYEELDLAVKTATAYARLKGCKDLYIEPVLEEVAVDWCTERMILKANIDGKDVVLLRGPLIKRQRRKLS